MITRQTWWLLGAAGMMLVAVLGDLAFNPLRSGGGKAADIPPPLPRFDAATITTIEYRKGGLRVRLEKREGQWVITRPLDYPAGQTSVAVILEALSNLRPANHIPPAAMEKSAANYGFQPPRAVLTLAAGRLRTYTLHLGGSTHYDDHFYLRVQGREGVYVMPQQLLKLLPGRLDDWRDRRLVQLGGRRAEVDTLRITTGPRTLLFQHNPTNRAWTILQPPPAKRGGARIGNLLGLLQSPQWNVSKFVTDNPAADLSSFGLDQPVAELALARGPLKLETIQFGGSPSNNPALIYARRLSRTNIVTFPKAALARLQAPVWEFCDHQLVNAPLIRQAADIGRIEVRGRENFVLEQGTNRVWVITQPVRLPADPELVGNLLKELESLKAVELEKDVVTDFSTYGLEPATARYTVLRRGAATNAVLAQVDFGNQRLEDRQTFARRSDETMAYRVLTSDRNKLPTRFFQLRHRRLWNFTPAAVRKLAVSIGDERHEFERNTSGQWTGKSGLLSKTDQTRFEQALAALGQLRAERWTERGADKLGLFGFLETRQRLDLEVRVGDQAVTHMVSLGKTAESASLNRYMAVPAHPDNEIVIFEVPRLNERIIFQMFYVANRQDTGKGSP